MHAFYSYKTRTHYGEAKHVHVMENQNTHVFYSYKTHTHYGEAKRVRVMEKQNMHAFYSYKTRTRYGEAKRVRVMEKQNAYAFYSYKTRTHYGEAKRAHVMENHKKWFYCMVKGMNKNNSLHHQYLGSIVIFKHHQEQHLKQPCLNSQEHKFSFCSMDTISRI